MSRGHGPGKVSPINDNDFDTAATEMEMEDTRDWDDINNQDDSEIQAQNELFQNLPSREATRSAHGPVAVRRQLSRRSLKRPDTQLDENNHDIIDRVSLGGTPPPPDRSTLEMIDVEEDYENVEESESMERIKAIPAPMAHKRSMKVNFSNRGCSLPKFQHVNDSRRKSKVKQLSCWKAFKLRVAMNWTLFKYHVQDFLYSLEPWRAPLKEVEGNFGNGVLSYFLFLKSLVIINILIFVIVFSFLSVPQIASSYDIFKKVNTTSAPSTVSNNTGNGTSSGNGTFAKLVGEICPAATTQTSRTAAEHILDFFTGQGWINTTIMFYSNYHNAVLVSVDEVSYNMPLAYLLVGGGYFIVSLLMMVHSFSASFTETVVESGGIFYSYCNKVFASWDYCIFNDKAASLKKKNIYQDLQAELAEEKRREKIRNRTRLQKCRIYSIRAAVNIVTMGILAASIYAIIKAVEVSTDPKYTTADNSFLTILARWASSLTITALNLVIPLFFEIITEIEEWSPRVEIAISLWRAVLLKLASVAVLVITLYTTYSSHNCRQCWENQIGAQMFNLVWIDFFVGVGATVVVETGRKYVALYLNCGCKLGEKIGMQEFQIPKNVLDLVYGQALIWIGAFFAPLLPAVGILKLIVLFYVKKISLIFNCKPSSKPYQGSRSNYFFTLLLLLTFLLCVVGVGWGITRVSPSCCGPYRYLLNRAF